MKDYWNHSIIEDENDFIFLVKEYILDRETTLNKGALKLRHDLIDFLRHNAIIIDYLYTEGVIDSIQAYVLFKYHYVYE